MATNTNCHAGFVTWLAKRRGSEQSFPPPTPLCHLDISHAWHKPYTNELILQLEIEKSICGGYANIQHK